MSQRRNLVIVRAGDNSVHPGWLAGSARDFDLFVSYFGNQPGRYAEQAEYHEDRKGMKWPVLGELLQAHPELVERYDYFWLPDDDLVADTATIDRMFAFARAYQLALAQPALTRNSYYTWPLLLQDARYQLRYTRFVEVMAPMFDRDALRTCLPTFTESTSGWGLDSVWPRLLADRGEQAMAIIDATAVYHSRPVGGGELYKSTGFKAALADEDRVMAKYGLDRRARVEARYFSSGVRQVPLPLWRRLRDRISRAIRVANYRRLEQRAHNRMQDEG
ncbi:DUF707 domain-containing protein [Thermomonas haemolytica]|uniref:Uncharacterized protein DUF707 n=2 Tax=Thermomonas TaxID=141948 RepID=A0A4R3N8S7_9GAMM|nr:DUF707 domain-containing protein [Thermomonas haemolytica]TCT25165.1 uncharacterized protein DUF707 [Thermomonas haemolytica]TNY30333.1 hypothetical protein BV505_00505 [Thermomonas haemolytica]